MTIREAQRLIFGGLGVMMVMTVTSIVLLSRMSGSASADPGSAGEPLARAASTWTHQLPGSEVWSDGGAAAAPREIDNYALAGTFQTYQNEDGSAVELKPVQAMALVDDLRSNKQHIVREGDELGSFRVAAIAEDQVTLIRGEQEFVLALSGEIAATPVEETLEEEDKPAPVRLEDMPALETSRFGKRVSDNQWVIDRQEVFRYAEEIMGNPYRATQLYRSFDQVAKKEGDEAGFRIQMKGEKDFFTDMGLGDGDIIRKVNSMQMKTQIRAEYLVREFMRSRMSAVVLDIENDGETRQQIFIVR